MQRLADGQKMVGIISHVAELKEAIGRKIKLRDGWEKERDGIMADIIHAKFSQNPGFAQALIDTDDAELIEGNTWNDNYWGMCGCTRCRSEGTKGLNKLGNTIPVVRTYLGGSVFCIFGGALLACGSVSGRVLKQIAVAPWAEGDGACARIITALLEESARRGAAHPFLYTKPKNARLFRSLGFFPVAETADMLMMEHRRGGVERYIASLPAYDGESGAVVCHANPFTRGHRHLVEYAAARCPHLYVFVLSEETGDFPAADRLELVRRGTADLPNVDVVPGGDYIISRATFPAYFLQGDPEQARCDLELTLFGKRIAPALGITRRFVGQEPYSPVTARYNQRMQALLPQWGIRVEEIPRLEGISASRVRQLLRQGRLAELQPLVPETTYAYCRDHFGAGAPCP